MKLKFNSFLCLGDVDHISCIMLKCSNNRSSFKGSLDEGCWTLINSNLLSFQVVNYCCAQQPTYIHAIQAFVSSMYVHVQSEIKCKCWLKRVFITETYRLSHQRVRTLPLVGVSSQVQNMKLEPKNKCMHLHKYKVKHYLFQCRKMAQLPPKLNQFCLSLWNWSISSIWGFWRRDWL